MKMVGSIGLFIIFTILALLLLYVVIEIAVKNGINNSILGRYLEEKMGLKEEKKRSSKDDFESDV